MIQLQAVTKYYGDHRAVDDVSFTVARGEVAALLGPNGSGKSTVMRMLTGFFSPTRGRVLIDGVDVARRPVAARARVGYLPEQVALYPELSVRRYLHFVGEVKGLGGRARRAAVDAVIGQCALEAVADRYAGKLSRGYRQRVGLAQALLGDPDVLVLDEATVGLDPVQTVEMRALLRTLAGARTLLLSTHILSEASALASRILILSQGRCVAEDTPAGLARRLEGLGRMEVRVDGPAHAVRATLAGLPGVVDVAALTPDGEPGVAFAVLAPAIDPARRAVAGAVVGAGWTLLELRVTPPSLEDLFVRLVGTPPAARG